MKAKEWLYKNGHIDSIGRGRISYANHELLRAAAEGGVQFSDWPKGEVKPVVQKSTNGGPDKVVAKVARDTTGNGPKVVAELAPMRWDEQVHVAREIVSGKYRGMRDVCQNCRVSLVQCWCVDMNIPLIIVATDGSHTGVEVEIVDRKTPLGIIKYW